MLCPSSLSRQAVYHLTSCASPIYEQIGNDMLTIQDRYANTFLTNMLSRAFFQRSWEEDGHISLSFVGSQTIGGGASAGVGDLTAMNKSYALDGTVKTSGPQQDGAAASTSSDQESGNATNLRFEARGENECILDVHT